MSEFLTPQRGRWARGGVPGRSPSSQEQAVSTPPRAVTGDLVIATRPVRSTNNMTTLEILCSVFGEELRRWHYGPSGVDPDLGIANFDFVERLVSFRTLKPPYRRYNTLTRMEPGDVQVVTFNVHNPMLFSQQDPGGLGYHVLVKYEDPDGSGELKQKADLDTRHAVCVIKVAEGVAWMYDNWGSDKSWDHFLVPMLTETTPEGGTRNVPQAGVRYATSTEINAAGSTKKKPGKGQSVYMHVNQPRYGLMALLKLLNSDDSRVTDLFPYRGGRRLSMVNQQFGEFCNQASEAPCQLFVNLMHQYNFPLTGISADFAYRYAPGDPGNPVHVRLRDVIRRTRPRAWEVGRDLHRLDDMARPVPLVDTFDVTKWRPGFQFGWTLNVREAGTLRRVTSQEIYDHYALSDELLRGGPGVPAGRSRGVKRKILSDLGGAGAGGDGSP